MDYSQADITAKESGLTDEEIKELGAVYTPNSLVQKMLDGLDIDWDNPPQDKTFLDPTCGNGQFLAELAKRGIPLRNIYGADLMPDNVEITHRRLLEVFGDTPGNREILLKNVVEADALTYDYDFGESDAYMEEW